MMLFEASTGRRGPHEFTHNLVAKMVELMTKAQPGTKWYRTDKQLGCHPDGEQVSKKKRTREEKEEEEEDEDGESKADKDDKKMERKT